jgi:hypothetical protein
MREPPVHLEKKDVLVQPGRSLCGRGTGVADGFVGAQEGGGRFVWKRRGYRGLLRLIRSRGHVNDTRTKYLQNQKLLKFSSTD